MLKHLMRCVIVALTVSSMTLAQDNIQERPQVPDDSPRITPTVRLLQKCLPAFVSIRTFHKGKEPKQWKINVGAGALIHPDGYILTNDHVVASADRGEVIFSDHRVMRYSIVATLPSEDLAIIKIVGDKPFPTIPLGRSNDLLLGEPVIALGTPAGLIHTASRGVISGLSRSTKTEHAFLPHMIQIDAAVSGGSSGGPVINAEGKLIGVVTSQNKDGENLGFAIGVDRIREVLPKIISAELRYGVAIGFNVDMFDSPSITKVKPASPAALSGMEVGDILKTINGRSISSGLDAQLALVDVKANTPLKVEYIRGQATTTTELKLTEIPFQVGVELNAAKNGIWVEGYRGQWNQLPEFDKLKPMKTGASPQIDLSLIPGEIDFVALRFRGFVKLPKDGLYTFYTTSDDGSSLRIGNELVVDNDGNHAAIEVAGMARLKAGYHAIEVQFFEGSGHQELRVSFSGPDLPKQQIPPNSLFITPEQKPKDVDTKPTDPAASDPKASEKNANESDGATTKDAATKDAATKDAATKDDVEPEGQASQS
jgi:S1-C subfamily serine protease